MDVHIAVHRRRWSRQQHRLAGRAATRDEPSGERAAGRRVVPAGRNSHADLNLCLASGCLVADCVTAGRLPMPTAHADALAKALLPYAPTMNSSSYDAPIVGISVIGPGCSPACESMSILANVWQLLQSALASRGCSGEGIIWIGGGTDGPIGCLIAGCADPHAASGSQGGIADVADTRSLLSRNMRSALALALSSCCSLCCASFDVGGD